MTSVKLNYPVITAFTIKKIVDKLEDRHLLGSLQLQQVNMVCPLSYTGTQQSNQKHGPNNELLPHGYSSVHVKEQVYLFFIQQFLIIYIVFLFPSIFVCFYVFLSKQHSLANLDSQIPPRGQDLMVYM